MQYQWVKIIKLLNKINKIKLLKIKNNKNIGVGQTISTISYNEHVKHEAEREEWEFENYPEGEIEEMVDIFEEKGLPREKAEEVIQIMSKYKDFFISIMVMEELQLKIPDPDESPYKEGFVTFCSFLLFGTIPLLGYIMIPLIIQDVSHNILFFTACLMTSLTLFIVGTIKSRFSSSSWLRCGTEFLLLGTSVAFTSYVIGYGVSQLVIDYNNILNNDKHVKINNLIIDNSIIKPGSSLP